MKLAIMQPYFLPYIGYFQLINMVDEFVIYDNIQFTKKGWINRNRILQNGQAEYFTIPLKKDSDYLNVSKRYLAENANLEITKSLRKVEANYKKAPYFDNVFPIIESVFKNKEQNLFKFVYNSVIEINSYIGINTKMIISSELSPEIEELKSQDKVLAICIERNANTYINPIGGKELYNKDDFKNKSIALEFFETNNITYPQFKNDFVPSLSIIDVMMFNSVEKIREMLDQYELI